MSKPIIFSYGGGIQSVSVLVLIANGELPKPELVIMADTGREGGATWDYTNNYTKPLMDKVGIKFEIVDHSYAKVDLYGKNGDMLLPAYTATGKLPTFCSNEWKKLPVRRRLRELGYGPKKPIVQWLGMSLDEVDRMRQSDVKWIQNHYPLCFDVKKRRHECELLIADYGLPLPPKSACWMCPNRRYDEWQYLKDNQPDEFNQAVQLERRLSSDDDKGGLFFTNQGVPLSEADFSKPETSQLDMCSYTCFT